MVSRELIQELAAEQWARLEQVELDYEWDAAWEAALAAGGVVVAAALLDAAREAGAGPRAAAVVAAAVTATELRGLAAESRQRLLLPLRGVVALAPAAPPQPSRSRRCPALAAVAALVGAAGP